MIVPVRPAEHHRRGQREPWLLALRRLWARGYSDARIAEMLSDLSLAAIERLEQTRQWNRLAIEAALVPGSAWLAWTRRQVRYWRGQLGLHAHPQRHECSPQAPILARAAASGWGHLLPLTRGELDILEVLAGGPATRQDLEAQTRLILDASRAGRRTPLRRLVLRQLVEIRQWRPCRIYALAPHVQRHVRTPFKTSLERMAERMGWLANECDEN